MSETTVDDKKDETNSATNSDSPPDYYGFAKTLGGSLLMIAQIITLGSVGLYICKIAQANILPDNLEQQPFSSDLRIPKDIPINMNILKQYPLFGFNILADDVPTTSQKATFNNLDMLSNYNKGIIGALRKRAKGSNIMLYYSTIFNECTSWNNWIINNLFIVLNKTLPEWVIMSLFGKYFIAAFLPFIIVLNHILSIISHVVNLPQMFRRKRGQLSGALALLVGKAFSTDSRVEWQSEDDISFFGISSWSNWFFLMLWGYPILLISTIVLPIVLTAYSIISPLFATYKLDGEKRTEPNTFFEFIKGVFAGHQVFIRFLFTFAVLAAIKPNLGKIANPAYGATLVGLLISIFMFNFFQSTHDPSNKTQTPGEVSYNQANVMPKGVANIKLRTMKINKTKQNAQDAINSGKELANHGKEFVKDVFFNKK